MQFVSHFEPFAPSDYKLGAELGDISNTIVAFHYVFNAYETIHMMLTRNRFCIPRIIAPEHIETTRPYL